MYRLLLLMMLSGSVLAAEVQEPALKSNGCPSSTPTEATIEISTNAPAPGAPPALKSSEAGAAEPDQRPRARSRGPAWHSFLPGMFK